MYTRKNISDGEQLNGQSYGKFIYVPDFSEKFNPTLLEIGEANIATIHEVGHQIDDQINKKIYSALSDRLSVIDSHEHEQEYLTVLRKLKTRSELGATELLLKAIELMQLDGVYLFIGTNNQLKALIMKNLTSQSPFLSVKLP